MKTAGLANLTNTYSIVALDANNRQLGAAMQTHNFEACNGVIWAEPGVAVVASQAGSDPFYAFVGFEMMHLGKTAEQTLHALLQCDPHPERNQVAIVDVHGNVAVHTGDKCIGETGHTIGKSYSCQANIMLNNTVWNEMAKAFERSQGELVDRMMDALEAAERAGGDIRGAQSAAIKVVSTEHAKKPWQGTLYDFRVYDDHQPLQALQRLISTKKAHEQAAIAQNMLYEENLDDDKVTLSIEKFNDAVNKILNMDSQLQHQCFYALSLFNKRRVDEALPLFKHVFANNPAWREVVIRVAKIHPEEPYAQNLDKILAE
jgi:uncharacterized Ntn-hydrolase superfamily protein